jgi:hypothetical protein
MLATQSIEARTRQERRVSLYDWIVYKRGSKAKEKERKKTSSTARSFIQSSSHVITAVLPSSASAVTPCI